MTSQTASDQTASTDLPLPGEAPAPRPLGEWIRDALRDAGLSETDTQTSVETVLPLFVAYLGEVAAETEWRYRSMTFFRGGCESETKLHPAGERIRARAAKIRAWLEGPRAAV